MTVLLRRQRSTFEQPQFVGTRRGTCGHQLKNWPAPTQELAVTNPRFPRDITFGTWCTWTCSSGSTPSGCRWFRACENFVGVPAPRSWRTPLRRVHWTDRRSDAKVSQPIPQDQFSGARSQPGAHDSDHDEDGQRVRHGRVDPGCLVLVRFGTHDEHRVGFLRRCVAHRSCLRSLRSSSLRDSFGFGWLIQGI